MKLYYAPGACSLSPHIVLRESGIDFTPIRTDLKSHKLQDGTDYYTINPKGYVPLLELDSGERLSEGPAIVQYLADQVPEKNLVPKAGTMERYRAMEWLNFITAELHKTYSPLFNPAVPEEYKTMAKAKLADRYKLVDHELEGKDYLMGAEFSVPDAYLYVVTNWAKSVGVDLSAFKNVLSFMKRMTARPAVQEALKAEGLTQ